MKSNTEEQVNFVDAHWGKRPGVTRTIEEHLIETDWCIANVDEDGVRSIYLDTEGGEKLCTVTHPAAEKMILEGLNMRAEHYGLRAYGRLHGKLPTQQALSATEDKLKALRKAYEELESHCYALETMKTPLHRKIKNWFTRRKSHDAHLAKRVKEIS